MTKLTPTLILKVREFYLRTRILFLAERRDFHMASAGAINGRLQKLHKTRNAINATIASREPAEKLLSPFELRPSWVRLGGHKPRPSTPRPDSPPPGQAVRP